MERGQHPKHHGFLVARFTVADNVPAELRVGLFREPKTYTAVIRFSNTGEHDDRVLDNHGMAIKVLGVKPTAAAGERERREDPDPGLRAPGPSPLLHTERRELGRVQQEEESRWCWTKA